MNWLTVWPDWLTDWLIERETRDGVVNENGRLNVRCRRRKRGESIEETRGGREGRRGEREWMYGVGRTGTLSSTSPLLISSLFPSHASSCTSRTCRGKWQRARSRRLLLPSPSHDVTWLLESPNYRPLFFFLSFTRRKCICSLTFVDECNACNETYTHTYTKNNK